MAKVWSLKEDEFVKKMCKTHTPEEISVLMNIEIGYFRTPTAIEVRSRRYGANNFGQVKKERTLIPTAIKEEVSRLKDEGKSFSEVRKVFPDLHDSTVRFIYNGGYAVEKTHNTLQDEKVESLELLISQVCSLFSKIKVGQPLTVKYTKIRKTIKGTVSQKTDRCIFIKSNKFDRIHSFSKNELLCKEVVLLKKEGVMNEILGNQG